MALVVTKESIPTSLFFLSLSVAENNGKVIDTLVKLEDSGK